MGVGEDRLAVGEEAGAVDESELRLAQRLRPRQARLLCLATKEVGGEGACRGGLHGPVGDQELSGARVEKGTAQSRDRLFAGAAAGSSIAGREHDPVRV